MMEELDQEFSDLEAKRKAEEEERRRRELEALNNKEPKPRKWYVPVKGDPIDELMAKYLNACPHYVPVKRMSEGQYMYGSKKIFAKINNGKLIIRVGGGYMLIDEFLANYAEQEMLKCDEEGIYTSEDPSPISKFLFFISIRKRIFFERCCKPRKRKQISRRHISKMMNLIDY